MSNIALQTYITDIAAFAEKASVVKLHQPVRCSDDEAMFIAAAKTKGVDLVEDTHSRKTLLSWGLIRFLDERKQDYILTPLGEELLTCYDSQNGKIVEDKLLSIGIKVSFALRFTDSEHDINPLYILYRFLCDPDSDGYVTDQEFANFLQSPLSKRDEDYDSIKKEWLAFRAKGPAAISDFTRQSKTWLFLPTLARRWKILEQGKTFVLDQDLNGKIRWTYAMRGFNGIDADVLNAPNDGVQPTEETEETETETFAPLKKYNFKVVEYRLSTDARKALEKFFVCPKVIHVDAIDSEIANQEPYLAAIRTKPFVLLAGISGTGKTRLVRQLARGCCHEPKLVSKETNTCGNYECIPVRPNWHDSTELLGYVTRITKNDEPPKYVETPFVEFLAKAWTYRETPFFLCLDEMNLAPVEQYFAEYLSVVESRDRIMVGDGADAFECLSSREKLVRFDALEKETKEGLLKELFDDKDWAKNAQHGRVQQVKAMFEKDGGIRLPPNLVVMGTVNMDETTCTFSRKVLDRAMSFELNKVDMGEGLEDDNGIDYGAIAVSEATPRLLNGRDAWTENQPLCEKVKAYLVEINTVLDKTPFKIAYRSRDEIMVYCLERTKGREDMLAQALDEATSMKILSRIEGDETAVRLPKGFRPDSSKKIDEEEKRALKNLLTFLRKTILIQLGLLDKAFSVPNAPTKDELDAVAGKHPVCASKLDEMDDRLPTGYTGFWR